MLRGETDGWCFLYFGGADLADDEEGRGKSGGGELLLHAARQRQLDQLHDVGARRQTAQEALLPGESLSEQKTDQRAETEGRDGCDRRTSQTHGWCAEVAENQNVVQHDVGSVYRGQRRDVQVR